MRPRFLYAQKKVNKKSINTKTNRFPKTQPILSNILATSLLS